MKKSTARWYILDAEHNVVPAADLLTWGRWLEDEPNKRIVRQDHIGDVAISTVFLGLDHRYGKGPPLVFETMIFGGELDQSTWRYASWDDAITGHAMAVKKVKQHTDGASHDDRD